MAPRPGRPAVTLIAVALLAFGCETGPDPGGTASGTASPTATGSGSPEATATTPEPAATPSGTLELRGWQQTHPGATSVALHAVEVDEHGFVTLDVEVVTGPNDVRLARFSTYLLDDGDAQHDLVPPGDNPEIDVPPDSRAHGTLAFEGPIDADATHVTLAINALNDRIVDAEDDDNPNSSGPKMAFRDIPLPGLGLEDEADRGASDDLVDAQSVDVEVTQTHPNGVVLSVTRIASDGRSVQVDVEVDNPTDREVRLLAGNPHLYDAPQQASRVGPYQWAQVDDAEVRSLDIPAGGEASATLAFRGTIEPDAESLELTLNGGADDDAGTLIPGFTVSDLPIPGRDGAGSSDDG